MNPYAGRYASAPRMGHGVMGGGAASGGDHMLDQQQQQQQAPYATVRSMTPSGAASRAYNHNPHQHMYSNNNNNHNTISDTMSEQLPQQHRTPSSTGLIRLSLKKPMGIVFEPMYDPMNASIQRGVRICDLPRTGAAALSRKLQTGDELLQINDTTVSRLTFDEIMDFIIEADPESVNLLFRRPRKETLQARSGVPQKLNAAANKDAPSTVKWVDETSGANADAAAKIGVGAATEKNNHHSSNHKSSSKKKKDKKKNGSSKKRSSSKKDSVVTEEDLDTLQTKSTAESYAKPSRKRRGSKKGRSGGSKRGGGGPYENESFLDMLIDTICSDSNNVCRDTFRGRGNDDYSDDESFDGTEEEDDTYATYGEESLEKAPHKNRGKSSNGGGEAAKSSNKYEDDGTLESVDTRDKVPPPTGNGNGNNVQVHSPLGLYPNPTTAKQQQHQQPVVVRNTNAAQQAGGGGGGVGVDEVTDDEGNRAPIKEVEYDDRIDHGADVSVMESLGGPSLLIEKQRAAQAAAAAQQQIVPAHILDNYGLDYPKQSGLTREQTVAADPPKFYTHVVRQLLTEHEPEKVRLLDKLLAKYKTREDHLVQKLSVRYSKQQQEEKARQEQQQQQLTDEDEPDNNNDAAAAFTDAVQKNKRSATAASAVHAAKERMMGAHDDDEEGDDDDDIDDDNDNNDHHRHRHHHNHHHRSSPRHHSNNNNHRDDGDNWPEKETKEPEEGDIDEASESGSEYSRDSVDGTSPAVIAQVSELLNYVYGKTSVPGQIDRVSTIMRAYEGREAVLLELLETKALIKANKEKENADNLPSFLRNSHLNNQEANTEENESPNLPPVTPMATNAPGQGGTVINDDISSMSGVSSPAADLSSEQKPAPTPTTAGSSKKESMPMNGASKVNGSTASTRSSSKPPVTPDKRKKKGLFGGLFGKKKRDESRLRRRGANKGGKSVEGSI